MSSAYYLVTSSKNFEKTVEDLTAFVPLHKFGVLHVHDLKQKMNSKGVEFAEQCQVFEVCNPFQAAKVLKIDM
jgi:uncharacterized protein (DUF302 family)